MDEYYISHIPFFLIPGIFVPLGLHKIIRHWRDGTEKSEYYIKRIACKIIACILCSLLDLAHIVDLSPQDYYSTNQRLMRTCYFSISAIAWLFSAFLVSFDYKRKILMQFWGQKGFWMLSFFSYTTLVTLNLLNNNFNTSNNTTRRYYYIQTIIYGISIALCFTLTVAAFFKPNDFFLTSQRIKEPLSPSSSDNEEEEQTDSSTIITKISSYKLKEQGSGTVVFFEIIVNFNKAVHKVSRTFVEFETLHADIVEKYPLEFFPGFELPDSPSNFAHLRLEEKLPRLINYLTSLCEQKFFVVELLDFLKVKTKDKESLILDINKGYEGVPHDRITRIPSEIGDYFDPKPMINETLTMSIPAYHLNWMIDVHIPTWQRADTHIEYHIKSEIRILSFEHWTVSRYSEMYSLHTHLRKQHIPIPNFPSKRISRSLKHIESDAIEVRRSQLEEYLGTIFNDPAYLSPISLKFINCFIDIERIHKIIPSYFVYELLGTLKWEGGLGSDSSHFITYVMKFRKSICGKSQEWEVSRRFREFYALHKILVDRSTSVLLKEFLKEDPKPLPLLPNRGIASLCTNEEIESRKHALEIYIKDLLTNNSVTCCYYFRNFIGEIE